MKCLKRGLRGDSWFDDQDYCRAAYRYCDDPDNRFGFVGFRLVGVSKDGSKGGASSPLGVVRRGGAW